MRKILALSFITILFVCCSRSQNFSGENNSSYDTITVYSIDKIVETSGNSDGFGTEVYYLVSSSNGAYRIDIDGLWANPQLIGVIKPNGKYVVKTEWFDAPIIKEYKRITKLIQTL